MRQILDNRHKIHCLESEKEKIQEDKQASSLEFAKNQRCEDKFRSWVVNKVMSEERVTLEDVIDAGSELVDCSQQAARRYLQKLCSSLGPLCVMEDQGLKRVLLKAEFVNPSPKEILEKQARNWKDGLIEKVDKEINRDPKVRLDSGISGEMSK